MGEFSFSLRKMKLETLFLFLVLISEASFIEEDDKTTINPIEHFSLFEKNQSRHCCRKLSLHVSSPQSRHKKLNGIYDLMDSTKNSDHWAFKHSLFPGLEIF